MHIDKLISQLCDSPRCNYEITRGAFFFTLAHQAVIDSSPVQLTSGSALGASEVHLLRMRPQNSQISYMLRFRHGLTIG